MANHNHYVYARRFYAFGFKYDSFISVWQYFRAVSWLFAFCFTLFYRRYSLFVFKCGVCDFDTLYAERFINVVGASGAICVLMGYYAYTDKSSTKGLIVAILLMSFAPIFMGINIAWYAHIFGFICGYALAKIQILRNLR